MNGVELVHPLIQVGETLLVDAQTDELYISFAIEPNKSKQAVFTKGRKLLLEHGFKKKKFRFVDDIHFTKRIINDKRVAAVTVKMTYTGSWNDVRIR